MDTALGRYFLLISLSFFSIITISAQQPGSSVSDLYVVSAEAGGINFVSGDVKVKSATHRPAVKGEKMVDSEHLITGTGSRAEVLLNPGSFLRVSQNTEFEFVSTNLNDLRIRLERGTAIIELYSTNDLTVSVSTADSEFRLTKSGIYRIDVLNGMSKISVWKGIAAVGKVYQRMIGKGMSLTVSGGQYSEAKFDRDIMDAFDSWSKLRSGELASLNAKLRRDSMQQSIAASMDEDWWRNSSTGIWVYDRYSRNHCFVPFGRRNNAYGHNVSQNFGSYNLPAPPLGNNNAANPSETPVPGVNTPRPERGHKYRKDSDNEETGPRERGRSENRNRDTPGDSQPAGDGGQVRNEDPPRVPRKMREDDSREVRENRREERREERRTEERRSRDEERGSESRGSDRGGSGSSSGGSSQSSPPPSPPPDPPSNSSPPPSNPSPPPDPPQRDSMPERKSDPPR